MDDILSIIILLFNWRIILCTTIGLLLSILLAQYVSWFDGRYGILIVAIALMLGVFWQEKKDVSGTDSRRPISNFWYLIFSVILFAILYSFLDSLIGALVMSSIITLGFRVLNVPKKTV